MGYGKKGVGEVDEAEIAPDPTMNCKNMPVMSLFKPFAKCLMAGGLTYWSWRILSLKYIFLFSRYNKIEVI